MDSERAFRLLAGCGEQTIMEVCGTHTSAIAKSGLHALLPANIRLVSGPGCPVCVTGAGYIDTLIKYSQDIGAHVLSFGDLFRVRGSSRSFAEAKADGASFGMVYSPLDALALARQNPEREYVVAAVGFETTAPLYALLLESVISEGIANIRLCASLKTIVPAMEYICRREAVDGFICPGHVSAIIGKNAYAPLLAHGKPLAIAGFEPESILAAVCHIAAHAHRGMPELVNLYGSVVTDRGNACARELIDKYFAPADGLWRGIDVIARSALAPRPEYSRYFIEPQETEAPSPPGCRCADVLLGKLSPRECALFGRECRPENPIGACMVSAEGACGIWYGYEGKAWVR